MNKKEIFYGLFITFFVFGIFITPVVGIAVLNYTTFPANDGVDDVMYNSTGDQYEFDGSGDFIDWIDMVKINITGNNIIITFVASGARSGDNYSFGLGIDVNNDNMNDFVISYFHTLSGYVMQNQLSGHSDYQKFWTGAAWSLTIGEVPWDDTGIYLSLETVVTAMADAGYTLASQKFRVYVYYTDLSTFCYADFIPELGEDGIPGFQITTLLFLLLTIVALISINNSKKKFKK